MYLPMGTLIEYEFDSFTSKYIVEVIGYQGTNVEVQHDPIKYPGVEFLWGITKLDRYSNESMGTIEEGIKAGWVDIIGYNSPREPDWEV